MWSKEDFFKPQAKVRAITVNGFDCYIRKMTLVERSDFLNWLAEHGGKHTLAQLADYLCCRCICDEQANLIITPEEWANVTIDGETIEGITLECLTFNGYKEKAIEAAKKN